MKRSEISDEYKWSVKDLYSSDELWNNDYEKALKSTQEKSSFEGCVMDSADTLADALSESEKDDYITERLYVYAFMRYYEDTSDGTYQQMSGKAQMLAVKMSEKYSFLVPEIMAADDDKVARFLDSDKIKPYRHLLCDMLAKKEHTCSQKEEKLLAMASQMADSPSDIFSKFNNADVKFGKVHDEHGDEKELTSAGFSVFMESRNRNVRKEAFYALYRQYKSYINTLAASYYGNVKQAVFFANARNYESTLQMYLSGSFIPESVYTNLIDTVNNNLDKMHDYVSLRKKTLGVDELHFYDIYAPLTSDYTVKVSYENAKEIVLDALKILGDDYVSQVKKGYESGWVDVYENDGKRSGAFSWGAYGTHPYIFLNYTETLNDIFTLIHETGHAMHTYYSNETQPYTYAGYKIFVAEVASTCNEVILIDYLLKHSRSDEEKKYLYGHYLEQFKGTLFRQTMFAEFEMITHRMAQDGEVLNAESLCGTYKKLNEKYFGKDMVIDEEIAYEWARIPHFYTPFYVYQYATGFSAAVDIATKIINGDKEVLHGYREFLKGGSSMHPIELLSLCKIDMSKPDVIQDALNVFGSLIEDFKKI
ncbi:oligoendopeptidase F [Lachnospira hominis (ex Hitch et al. 2024)]|uniref:Oligopeptidase F n=1 Tax=Lachnospira intestinalis TaxID=3133158 RepID=A0ABV1GL11_9FIRM